MGIRLNASARIALLFRFPFLHQELQSPRFWRVSVQPPERPGIQEGPGITRIVVGAGRTKALCGLPVLDMKIILHCEELAG